MPIIAPITSMTAGIPCTPHMLMQGSPTVVAQGLAVGRVGDAAVPQRYHGAKKPHGTAVATGSSTVLTNGIPTAYVGSQMTCGDVIGTSPTSSVIIGI